jgi:biopolymer transport protein ExbB/TolQ
MDRILVCAILSECDPWQSGCDFHWTIGYLWYSWDWFGRATAMLLVFMAAYALTIACNRFYLYCSAGSQSRRFLRETATALRDGKFDEVIAAAARNNQSPVASQSAEGLLAFASISAQLTDREALDAVERAMARARSMLVTDLLVGLSTLRTIAGLAPFIGLLGTCFGILSAFRGTAMEKSEDMAFIASLIAEALMMTAAGLCVGVLALWLHNYLWRRVELLKTGILEAETRIIDALRAHPEFRHQRENLRAETRWGLLTAKAPVWEVSYDRQRALLLAMLLSALYLALMFTLERC